MTRIVTINVQHMELQSFVAHDSK